MMLAGPFHLTYCSNIHRGESWKEVRDNLAAFLPAIRERLAPASPFGVGLRLSARAAETLEQGDQLGEFQDFLDSHGCYVFTLNGFPYGAFHGEQVKEKVYLPDWTEQARLDYTRRLARILSVLLPDQPGLEGSISTVPGAFRQRIQSPQQVERMAHLMLRQVAHLNHLREQTGKTLTLALEPEPCCYLETVEDAVAFFQDHLFGSTGLQTLATELGVSTAQAEAVARRHIGLCYDACHMAVEFEEVSEALGRLKAAGIQICKVQITSALKLRFREGDGRAEKTFRPFAEETYLHQVVEKSPGGLIRYPDLSEALASEGRRRIPSGGEAGEKEWRVHFHVPVFLNEMEAVGTTQDHLVSLIDFLKKEPLCPYLEVETYTWDVVPSRYKTEDTAGAILRELCWVRDRIQS